MIEMLLAEGTLDAVPLRTLIYGASPISPETLRRVQAVDWSTCSVRPRAAR